MSSVSCALFPGLFIAFAVSSGLLAAPVASTRATPVELGDIEWRRDFAAATEEAHRAKRPLLVLFDEVPGCATCVGYGRTTLSHPLIVEAAETLFVPVAVYNNVEGADRDVLTSFQEPTWNNPVVRFMSADRAPLAPRLAEDYSVVALASSMVTALEASGVSRPGYLALLAAEEQSHGRTPETASFAMHCFWEGEALLGGFDGVVATRTGWIEDSEVVEVQFDPSVVEFGSLVTRAAGMQCAHHVHTTTPAQRRIVEKSLGKEAAKDRGSLRPTPGDDKHALRSTPWRFVPMTPMQAARVNAAVAGGRSPAPFLSPRQIALHDASAKSGRNDLPVMIGRSDLEQAMKEAITAIEPR